MCGVLIAVRSRRSAPTVAPAGPWRPSGRRVEALGEPVVDLAEHPGLLPLSGGLLGNRKTQTKVCPFPNHQSNDSPHHLRAGPGSQIIAPSLEVTFVRGLR